MVIMRMTYICVIHMCPDDVYGALSGLELHCYARVVVKRKIGSAKVALRSPRGSCGGRDVVAAQAWDTARVLVTQWYGVG